MSRLIQRTSTLIVANTAVWFSCSAAFAEEDGHHLPHNHIAVVVGRAYERASDGHEEEGNLLGVDWEYQFDERWGVGIVFEQEAFGGNTKANRHSILAVPVSYHLNDRWRVFGAVGMEFRDLGDPDEPLIRLGTGYNFHIGKHFTIAPELMFDFISGGDKVYVFGLAFGYGF